MSDVPLVDLKPWKLVIQAVYGIEMMVPARQLDDVLLVASAHPFGRVPEVVYAVTDPDDRERLFDTGWHELHHPWAWPQLKFRFERLGAEEVPFPAVGEYELASTLRANAHDEKSTKELALCLAGYMVEMITGVESKVLPRRIVMDHAPGFASTVYVMEGTPDPDLGEYF